MHFVQPRAHQKSIEAACDLHLQDTWYFTLLNWLPEGTQITHLKQDMHSLSIFFFFFFFVVGKTSLTAIRCITITVVLPTYFNPQAVNNSFPCITFHLMPHHLHIQYQGRSSFLLYAYKLWYSTGSVKGNQKTNIQMAEHVHLRTWAVASPVSHTFQTRHLYLFSFNHFFLL